MDTYSDIIKEVQKVELGILKEVAALCEKYNLRYYLSSGTLLGAVRHKGFIPWDDDIDIFMPRDDHERFLDIAKRELPDHLFLQHHTTDKNFCLLITKVRDNNSTFIEPGGEDCIDTHQGIYIDIFPLDTAPESRILQVMQINILRVIWKVYFMKKHCFYAEQSLLQRINLIMYKLLPVGSSFLAWVYEKICKACLNKSGKYVAVLAHSPRYKKVKEKAWFAQTSKFEFEGELFDGPVGYDEYLKHSYNNYLELPPEEERKLKHYILCDPYKSYKEYIRSQNGVCVKKRLAFNNDDISS